MASRRAQYLLALALVLLALAVGGYRRALFLLTPVDPAAGAPVEVVVPPGANTREISRLLEEKGLIRNAFLFRLFVSWSGFDGRLQAGDYLLSPRMSAREIAERLKKGEVILLSFTVPEGYRVGQIVQLLTEKGFGEKDAFLAASRDKALLPPVLAGASLPPEEPLEGVLFPDTYRFPKGFSEREIIKLMTDRFQQVYSDLLGKAGPGTLSPYETLILASIIEKEAMVDQERPLISAVYHNRLKIGMKLDADPTVRYGLKKFTGPLLVKDLNTPSPYNTYLQPGLPPGPIANPGRASLEAALHPANVDYLYFVAKNDGTHVFSRTYQEHLLAVSKYQKAP